MEDRLKKEMELYGIKSPNVISMELKKGGLVSFKTKKGNKKGEIVFNKHGKLINFPTDEAIYINKI